MITICFELGSMLFHSQLFFHSCSNHFVLPRFSKVDSQTTGDLRLIDFVGFDTVRNVLNRNFSNSSNRIALRFQMLKTRRSAVNACVNGKSQRAFTEHFIYYMA
jgi:hypothetical protein